MYFRTAQEMWTPPEPFEGKASDAPASREDLHARIEAHQAQITLHTAEIQRLRRMLDQMSGAPRARLR
jgi:hypothetical protein